MKNHNKILRILGHICKFAINIILFIVDFVISNIEIVFYIVGACTLIYFIIIFAPLIIAAVYVYISLGSLIVFSIAIILAILAFLNM
ncbi:unnamed protein product [Commensalibacter communis]|uniref:Uncharacterized protein n=1 Tax=Commensalibacter communis TaxID=2972786 RepID=A0A9W4TMR7_9PROT|nr:unnamed protein product [Commensalibacter communis]CAI3934314.1 unnamed protein product [Commensalibacter communis]CAI3943938.1 unnamed protein product [Commensalibacter communis]CAI3950574.1 unnamed protein product [Commensalibacter communis]CAI3952211.1 unnamed protein product [Commensalibacter communis]